MDIKEADETERLLKDIQAKEGTSEYSTTRIRTDERVIARITDGIYRQPASALRELLANAFDADATEVSIDTDAPRFAKITVRDNGSGLGKATLAHILHHIGGSSKRTKQGAALNVANRADPTLSPSGRRLIGKIGIGLFSVAQLTPHFQIISKVKGESFRRVADVLLTTYTEDELAKSTEQDGEFEAGSVNVWSIPADDVDAHGTDIVLMDLKKQAQRLLRSQERWAALREKDELGAELQSLKGPVFHIGEVDLETGGTIERTASLPWAFDDPPRTKFKKLVEAVVQQTSDRSTPGLADVLDNYLQMLWLLGLALPFEYVDRNPLREVKSKKLRGFMLSNQLRGQATEIVATEGQSFSAVVGLESGAERNGALPFVVKVDGIELCRPINLNALPSTSHALKERLLFLGKCKPDLGRIPDRFRGGDLSFEAYFYWAPKIAPKDHNGVMVRINDASGTLFDGTFMRYQVAEQTRLRQIVGEIFVIEGLDAALNIDRESFNYAHPHYLFLQRWVHEALRQITNQQKRLSATVREQALQKRGVESRTEIEAIVAEEWQSVTGEELESLPRVVFVASDGEGQGDSTAIALNRNIIFESILRGRRRTSRGSVEQDALERKIAGIAQVLDGYGLLEGMSAQRRAALLRAIVRIIESGEV